MEDHGKAQYPLVKQDKEKTPEVRGGFE